MLPHSFCASRIHKWPHWVTLGLAGGCHEDASQGGRICFPDSSRTWLLAVGPTSLPLGPAHGEAFYTGLASPRVGDPREEKSEGGHGAFYDLVSEVTRGHFFFSFVEV